MDETYILKMEKQIKLAQASFVLNFEGNMHSKWLVLKYEICKVAIGYSKNKAHSDTKRTCL